MTNQLTNHDIAAAKPLPCFKRELRKAIREGRKTMTRRLIPNLREWPHPPATYGYSTGRNTTTLNVERHDIFDKDGNFARSETKVIPVEQWAVQFASYTPGDLVYLKEPLKSDGTYTTYADDGALVTHDGGYLEWRWTRQNLSSIQFPREAARWFGRITDVRVERVQSITREDAIAEGVHGPGFPASLSDIGSFAKVFDACHPGAWQRNDYVWVYSFEKVKVQHDK